MYLKNNRLPACRFLLTGLFLASALLTTTVSADLLLSKAINESVPQSSTSPIDSVDFKIFLEDQSGSFSPSATTRISDGPAIMSIPTWPNTCRLAAAT